MNAISENYPLIWAKKEIEFWSRIENNLKNRLDNNYSIVYLLVFCNKDNRPNYVKLNSIRTKSGKERKPFGIYIQKNIENTNYHLDISAEYNEFGYNSQKEKGIKINLTVEHNKSENIRDNSEIREVVNIISIPINTNINFYHYKNNDMLTFDLFEEDFFDKITEELTEEILNYIFTIEKYEEKIYQSIK